MPRRALGSSLPFLTLRGRYKWIILAIWIAHFISFLFCNKPAKKNLWRTYAYSWTSTISPVRAITLFAGPPLPLQAYVLYEWPLRENSLIILHVILIELLGLYKQRNKANSAIFRNYSGAFRTLCNPGIFRTLVYSNYRHIQNQRYIQNPRHVKNPVKHLWWSVLRKLVTAVAAFANYNDFAISTFQFLYFFNESLCFTPEIILCKKVRWPRGTGVVKFDIPMLCCNFLFIIA